MLDKLEKKNSLFCLKIVNALEIIRNNGTCEKKIKEFFGR